MSVRETLGILGKLDGTHILGIPKILGKLVPEGLPGISSLPN
jgi:hypothetical protein